MLSPPTDRLHKFLAIAGIALFIVGITVPLDRWDQAVRQFIEAKAKALEVGQAQMRLSNWLDALKTRLDQAAGATADSVTQAELARLPAEAEKFEREIADLSVQARKQLDLAEHAERARTVWMVLGTLCLLGGAGLATAGFAMWWREPPDMR